MLMDTAKFQVVPKIQRSI